MSGKGFVLQLYIKLVIIYFVMINELFEVQFNDIYCVCLQTDVYTLWISFFLPSGFQETSTLVTLEILTINIKCIYDLLHKDKNKGIQTK